MEKHISTTYNEAEFATFFIECLKKYYQKYQPTKIEKPELPDLLNIKQAAELLGLSPATLYTKVHYRTIPYIKTKGSKTLRFSKVALMEWLQEGSKETKAQMEQRAMDYLVKR
jgi:excisionase family DNA binding protein